jgi:hypothetical protein
MCYNDINKPIGHTTVASAMDILELNMFLESERCPII